MPEKEKAETLHQLLIDGEESGFTSCALEEINRELDQEEGIMPDEVTTRKLQAEERWRSENARAIDAYNDRLAKRGGPFASAKRRF